MTDSEDNSDENVEDVVKIAEQQPKTEEVFDRKSLPKHLKQKFWNSWEELRLIELWRVHFNEVTDLEQNMPIYRTIGAGLRDSGYHMNAQEVRRKMKTMKNRYIQECRRLKDQGGKSEWRLYRLMHCLMSPRRPNCDVNIKQKTLEAVTAKNKSEPLFRILASGMPVNETLKRIERGEEVEIPEPAAFEVSFPIENKTIAASILCAYENNHRLSFTPRVFRHNYEVTEQAKKLETTLESLSRKIFITPSGTSTTPLQLPKPLADVKPFENQQKPQYKYRSKFLSDKGILKSKVNEVSLKAIRAENRNLMEEVLLAAKKLKQEEQQLKSYERMTTQVKKFYEKILEKMEISDV